MVPAYRARTGKNARSTADTNNVGNEPANQNTARPAIHSSTRARSPLLFKGGAPVQLVMAVSRKPAMAAGTRPYIISRSEEHTSELQSRGHLVCRLLLEKKKPTTNISTQITTRAH